MAIGYCRVEAVQIEGGSSAVGMSSYISRSENFRELDGQKFNFQKVAERGEVLAASRVCLPRGVGKEWSDRQRLWNAAEAAEVVATGAIRKRAQLAFHMVVALPNDAAISDADRLEMIERWVHENITSRGLAAEYGLHKKDGNYHAHILISTRKLGPEGFGKKDRDFYGAQVRGKKKAVVEKSGWQTRWTDFQNAYFAERGLDITVDEKAPVPQLHEGPVRHRKGGSEKGAENATRQEENAEAKPEDYFAKLTERRATFTTKQINSVLRKAGLDVTEIPAMRDQILGHPEIIELYTKDGHPTGRYTTKQVREQEQATLTTAATRAADYSHLVAQVGADLVAAGKPMDPEQAEAYRLALEAGGFVAIEGRAGTGKSYTMDAIRQAYEKSGYNVIGMAPTNAVVADMKRDGFKDPRTVSSAIWHFEHPDVAEKKAQKGKWLPWDNKTVLIIDEAAMLSTETTQKLLHYANVNRCKVIFVGDDRQLSSIQRGGLWGNLREFGVAIIGKVRRQKIDWMRQASEDLSNGRIAEAMRAYHDHGKVHFGDGADATKTAIIAKWQYDVTKNPDVVRFIYAATNEEVDELNERCRQYQVSRGKVSPGITFNVEKAGRKFEQTIGVGDRIQFNSTAKQVDELLVNGNFGTVLAVSKDKIKVKLDSDEIVSFSPAEYKGYALGYAGTVYKGQGKTQEETYALGGWQWEKRTTYVGATRHKNDFNLFIDQTEFRTLDSIIHRMIQQDDSAASVLYKTHEEILAQEPEKKAEEKPLPPLLADGEAFPGQIVRVATIAKHTYIVIQGEGGQERRAPVEPSQAKEWLGRRVTASRRGNQLNLVEEVKQYQPPKEKEPTPPPSRPRKSRSM